MTTLLNYAKQRHFCKAHGFGKPWVRWLWFDAVLYAIARSWTLRSLRFRLWCSEVDEWFEQEHEWPRSYVTDTGADCWIDSYWQGMSPREAFESEVSHWGE